MRERALKRGLWYFAHPLTAMKEDGSRDWEKERENFHLANKRAVELLRRGYNIFSPISHSYPIQDEAGHEEDCQFPWYLLDEDIIRRTKWDGLILAPGWENSKGCNAERRLFESLKLPIKLYQEIIEE